MSLKIRDKLGSPVDIDMGETIILVGPNNSGKSLFLREFEKFLLSGRSENNKIIESIEFSDDVSDEEFEKLHNDAKININANMPEDWTTVGRINYQNGNIITVGQIIGGVAGIKRESTFRRLIAASLTLRIDGSRRLFSMNESQAEDMQKDVSTMNGAILKYKDSREKIRSIVEKAFKLWISTDITGMKTIRVRFSEEKPTEEHETSVSKNAIDYHASSIDYSEIGDGVKAFSGIIANMVISKDIIFLIDEPEAFLHPPLAMRMGEEITKITKERGTQLIAATHSSSFIIGALQSGGKVKIIRLSYMNRNASIKVLDSENVKSLLRNPVMRSSNVLAGLFHDGVIITEDDSDRVLYNEVAHRISSIEDKKLNSILFLNSNGKSALHKMAAPLRLSGVPSAICADFDLIFEAADFGACMRAANIPLAMIESYNILKSRLMESLPKEKLEIERKNAKSKGVSYFREELRAVAEELVNRLAEYGIFIIPSGELESWLPQLEVTGHKVGRVIQLLERMGGDPEAEGYVKPSQGDVWDYMRKVMNWINDSNRKGM